MKKILLITALSLTLPLGLISCQGEGQDSTSNIPSSSETIQADRITISDDCPTEIALGVPFSLKDYIKTTPNNASLSYRPITENITVTSEGIVTAVAPGDFAVMVESGATRRRFEGKAVSQNLLDVKEVLKSLTNNYQAVGVITDASDYSSGYLDINVHNDNYFWSYAQNGGILGLDGYSYTYELESTMEEDGSITMGKLTVNPGRYSPFDALIYGTPLSDYSDYVEDILDQNGDITGTIRMDRAAMEDLLYYVFGGMSLSSLEMIGGCYQSATYTVELFKDEEGNLGGIDFIGSSPTLGTSYLTVELTAINETGLVEPVEDFIKAGVHPQKLENPKFNERFAKILSEKAYTIEATASVGSFTSEDENYDRNNWIETDDSYVLTSMENDWGFHNGSYTRYVNETTVYSINNETKEKSVLLPHNNVTYQATGDEEGWDTPSEAFTDPELNVWSEGVGITVDLGVNIGSVVTYAGFTFADLTTALLEKVDYNDVKTLEDGTIRASANALGDEKGAFFQVALSNFPMEGPWITAMISCLQASGNPNIGWQNLIDLIIVTLKPNGDITLQFSLSGLALNEEASALFGMLWEISITNIGVDQVPSNLEAEIFGE